MSAETLSRRWYLCGITYLVIGISLGVYMGAVGDHSQFPAHAHLNLLGWASMCLTGLLYRTFPGAARSALARWHFWLYQLAVPVMLGGVFAFYMGHPETEAVIGVASVVTLISVVLFWVAIFSARNSTA